MSEWDTPPEPNEDVLEDGTCIHCMGEGEVNGSKCKSCTGKGWDY